jgi:hypothetical protein
MAQHRPRCDLAPRVIRDGAVHREATIGANREGHKRPHGGAQAFSRSIRILGNGITKRARSRLTINEPTCYLSRVRGRVDKNIDRNIG